MSRHQCFTVQGKPFLSIGGQSRNSSAFTYEDAAYACRSVVALSGNTIALPVSWEKFEPKEGQYDSAFVQGLIDLVRSYDLRLVILWFASWKNGTMEYCPAWVKADRERFPRTMMPDGEETFVISAHAESTQRADARAFVALMQTVRGYDMEHSTVIGVQVENESGIYAPVQRDFGPLGERDFHADVPSELIAYAQGHPDSLLAERWRQSGGVLVGDWSSCFGADAAEACSAWHIARYVDYVAVQGKKIYDLPMYTNAWVDLGNWHVGGLDYPCGGPMGATLALDIWRCAAPDLDWISPDLYDSDYDSYRYFASLFAKPEEGWPLFVPESFYENPNPAYMFHAIGELGAIGNHVFAVEDLVDSEGIPRPQAMPFVRSHRMLLNAQELVHKFRGSDSMHTLVQRPGMRRQRVPVNEWWCYASYDGPDFRWNGTDFRHMEDLRREFDPYTDIRREAGRALVFQTGPNEFYMVGHAVRLFFAQRGAADGSIPTSLMSPVHAAAAMPTISIDEGHIEHGQFIIDRPRTGDEARHGVWLSADCGLVRVRLVPSRKEA